MNTKGVIMVIENDEHDRYILNEAFKVLNYPNEIIYFFNGEQALEYLNTKEAPFIILSDVLVPKLNGFDLKKVINADPMLKLKSIPFVFFSTARDKDAVINTYLLTAQGYFVKQSVFEEMCETIKVIIEYWKRCVAPNRF
jgi:CheY-like chemotaxis protein